MHASNLNVEDNTMQINGRARDSQSTSYEQRKRCGESGAVICGTAYFVEKSERAKP